MTHEKALLVVVGVDEPAGHAVGAVAANFARVGMKNVHAIHLHAYLPVFLRQNRNVRLAEHDEEVALAGVLEVVGHVQIGVHTRLEDGHSAEVAELRGMRFVVEGAGDQHVETSLAGFARGGREVGPLHRAKLRADENGGAFFGA